MRTSAVCRQAELLTQLESLHLDPELCDVTFRVGLQREEVLGVSALLAAGSDVFRRLLFGPMRESRERVVDVDECSRDAFEQLVRFLHSGKAALDSASVMELWQLADRFQVPRLKEACSGFLGAHCLAWDNALYLYQVADRHGDAALRERARRLAAQSGALVLCAPELDELDEPLMCDLIAGDDFAAPEEAIFSAVLRWGRAQLADQLARTGQLRSLSDVVAKALAHVRLPLVPAVHLTTTVQQSGVVPPNRVVEALAYQADPSAVVGGTDRRQFTRRAPPATATTAAARATPDVIFPLDANGGDDDDDRRLYEPEEDLGAEDDRRARHARRRPPPPRRRGSRDEHLPHAWRALFPGVALGATKSAEDRLFERAAPAGAPAPARRQEPQRQSPTQQSQPRPRSSSRPRGSSLFQKLAPPPPPPRAQPSQPSQPSQPEMVLGPIATPEDLRRTAQQVRQLSRAGRRPSGRE